MIGMMASMYKYTILKSVVCLNWVSFMNCVRSDITVVNELENKIYLEEIFDIVLEIKSPVQYILHVCICN